MPHKAAPHRNTRAMISPQVRNLETIKRDQRGCVAQPFDKKRYQFLIVVMAILFAIAPLTDRPSRKASMESNHAHATRHTHRPVACAYPGLRWLLEPDRHG
jgi:hypothetical protein